VGAGIGHEVLTGWVFAALPLIAAALAMILYGPTLVAALTARKLGGWPANTPAANKCYQQNS